MFLIQIILSEGVTGKCVLKQNYWFTFGQILFTNFLNFYFVNKLINLSASSVQICNKFVLISKWKLICFNLNFTKLNAQFFK